MKPSRKPAVKVTVTISQENMPQWYEFLRNIDSGHVRAAILRAHLKNPGEAQVFQQPRNDSPARQQASAAEPAASPVIEAALQAGTTPSSPPAPPVMATPEAPSYPATRGGLASAMLRAGQAPRW